MYYTKRNVRRIWYVVVRQVLKFVLFLCIFILYNYMLLVVQKCSLSVNNLWRKITYLYFNEIYMEYNVQLQKSYWVDQYNLQNNYRNYNFDLDKLYYMYVYVYRVNKNVFTSSTGFLCWRQKVDSPKAINSVNRFLLVHNMTLLYVVM